MSERECSVRKAAGPVSGLCGRGGVRVNGSWPPAYVPFTGVVGKGGPKESKGLPAALTD